MRSHRFTTLSQLGFTLLALTSCAEPSDVPPDERAGVSAAPVSDSCRSVGLRASKSYSPLLWFDTERTLSAPVKVALAAEIAVLAGNAGNQESTFQYRLGAAGALVSCTYRGGADDAHPVSPAQIANGQHYVFESCTNGAQAGDIVEADYVKLHVDNGDSNHFVTGIQLILAELEPCQAACDPANVDDGDPCTLDLCDPATDEVTHIACTPIDPTVATTLGEAAAWLYSGPNPVQTSVVPGTIDPTRVAVLRGQVKTRDGAPLSGVTIRILQQDPSSPDFGQTLTHTDGFFDMAVNGGGIVTVVYEKDGYLPVQRAVEAPWVEYAPVDDVVMIPYDAQVTAVDLAVPGTMQVARGSVVTDADGTRQATVLFPPNTGAQMVFAGGSVQPLTTLHVRATEYTVGEAGPETMPATLPPTSAYTYAFELSVDEAVAVGATSVEFTQPVVLYAENFLGFPVGGAVPIGFYDRSLGQWVPAPNGRIIAIVTEANGMADVDTDGDGMADSAPVLAALGITLAEREQLAALYAPGQSLWRAAVTHFTPWDMNWPFGPPADACAPADPECDLGDGPVGPSPEDDPCEQQGSTIECQNQILGEDLPLAGTPFRLHYRSDRTAGRKDAFTMTIPLTPAAPPASLKSVELRIEVGGRVFSESFACPCAPNDTTSFTWDGKDVYGRTLQGSQPATVLLGYTYDPVYLEPAAQVSAFAAWSGVPMTATPGRDDLTIWKSWQQSLGTWVQLPQGLGGWSLSAHHAYDPVGRVLYYGDGTRRSARNLDPVVTTSAGSGSCSPFNLNEGGPATAACSGSPQGVAVAPDGTIYFADSGSNRIRKVTPGGIITTVAGKGVPGVDPGGFDGDNKPATDALLLQPQDVALGPDGSVYIADLNNNRVRRVTPDGIITTVAGNGLGGYGGDGGPAIAATVGAPQALAVGSDGSVYITSGDRIRRVSPEGVIDCVAGQPGVIGALGDGGPAREGRVNGPQALAVGPDGSLYIADTGNNRVRRVSPDGIITTIAGTGGGGDSGDGGQAILAEINSPRAVAVGRDGSVYVVPNASGQGRVRRISPDGIITTVVGGPALPGCINTYCGDGGPATAADFKVPEGLAVGPDGSLYIAASGVTRRILRIAPVLPGVSVGTIALPSEDGSEVYFFDELGKHVSTRDALTGAFRYQFAYDGAGRLEQVTDVNNLETTILRDVNGTPTAIVSPYSQQTSLTVHPDGYLATVTNPEGEAVGLTYKDSGGGLLETLTDPKLQVYAFEYDALGRLTKDSDPASGFKMLARTETNEGYSVDLTTAMGRTTTYEVNKVAMGGRARINTAPSGLSAELQIATDGTRAATLPDGTETQRRLKPDPRFGMLAPLVQSTTTTPSGKTRTVTQSRAVTLGSPNDVLSLTSLTDTTVVNGKVFTSVFDKATGKRTATSPFGRQAVTTLDAQGRVVKHEVPGVLPMDFFYDPQGRLQTTQQGTRSTSRSYGSNGYLAVATDPLMQTQSFTVDAVGRITVEKRADAEQVLFDYDPNGNQTSVTPPGQPGHGLGFTPVDLLGSYTPPALPTGPTPTTWTYNLDRQLDLTTRPDGSTIDYVYDSAGRLFTTTFPGAALTRTYHPTTGKLQTITGSTGVTLTYGFDGSLPTDLTWSGAVTGNVHRDYDNDFRIVAESVNGSGAAAFGYDADSLLTQADALTVTRDPQNGRITGTTLGSVSDGLSYSPYGEVSAYAATFGASALLSVSYVRDDLGRIVTKIETVDGATHAYGYSYDLVGRLTDVTRDAALVAHYDYHANGNRQSRTTPTASVAGTYDDQDRLLTYGTMSYEYEDSGELAMKMDSATGSTTSYTYDVLGNLRSAVLTNGATIEYVVDGENRRVGKKVGGVLVKAWLYRSALQPVAELDSAGNVVARFVYATGMSAPELMVKGGVTYRIVRDHLGSPRLVVDSATGAIAQRMNYDEFGMVTLDTNPGFQPFGFAGGLYDSETGLVRFGARDYDAEMGRWTAKDPILFAGRDTDLYGYVFNDPVNLRDPSGHGPLGFFSCLLSGQSLSDCLDEEWDKFSKGPLGDCTYDPEHCLSGQAVSPYRRLPNPRYPEINACAEKALVSEIYRCCKDVCNFHPDEEPEVCNPNPPESDDEECYRACLDQFG